MRINQFIAQHVGLSRRRADDAITNKRVTVNGRLCKLGENIIPSDIVCLDGNVIDNNTRLVYLILNKPVGYVCSRNGQGAKTIYDLLPSDLKHLKSVGRLDKDSSGLLLLTNDGELANKLIHPSYEKEKIYEVVLDKPLSMGDQQKIYQGVPVETYISQMHLQKLATGERHVPNSSYLVTLTEGKNRQIRRTFSTLGYNVTKLHRTKFGEYTLGSLENGKYLLTSG